jgi:DNA-binding transcriptional LysR family regulator
MRRRFDVVYRRDGYLSPAAQKLIALLRAQGRSHFSRD